jgi:hypothetical protein
MDKYHKLKGHLDTIVNDANNEISQLRFNLDRMFTSLPYTSNIIKCH